MSRSKDRECLKTFNVAKLCTSKAVPIYIPPQQSVLPFPKIFGNNFLLPCFYY